jgi:O-antigen/teichoic acid export membrane protein
MRALSGLNKLVGFGLSMALLAIAALVAIPAMIRSSGENAWGAIALGQNLGAFGAMLIAYGWGIFGPAEIAQGDQASRTVEFLASIKVRLILLVPTLVVVVVPSLLLSPLRPDLAAVGAVVAALTGLTATWFFVGLARPYALMALETVPRVAFTVVGIVEMERGADALYGLIWQGVGLLAAFVASLLWILRYLRYRPGMAAQLPGTLPLLKRYGGGVASSLGSQLYTVLPLVIVTTVAPLAQPMFALIDKLYRQVLVALLPIVSVLQGWVPRGEDPAQRVRTMMWWTLGMCATIGVGTVLVGPWILHFLGAGALTPTAIEIALLAVLLAVTFFVSVLGHAVLGTYRELRALARSTTIGTLIGMPLVAVGVWFFGVPGALLGMLIGMTVRLSIKLAVTRRCLRSGPPPAPRAAAETDVILD